MNKTMKHIVFAFLIATVLLACSQDDWFENIQPEVNFFAVPAEATGEEAELRRDFFEDTKIYLLFNDTLGVHGDMKTFTISLRKATSSNLGNNDLSFTMRTD